VSVDSDLLKMISAALTDFADLNCYAALQLLLEVLHYLSARSYLVVVRKQFKVYLLELNGFGQFLAEGCG